MVAPGHGMLQSPPLVCRNGGADAGSSVVCWRRSPARPFVVCRSSFAVCRYFRHDTGGQGSPPLLNGTLRSPGFTRARSSVARRLSLAVCRSPSVVVEAGPRSGLCRLPCIAPFGGADAGSSAVCWRRSPARPFVVCRHCRYFRYCRYCLYCRYCRYCRNHVSPSSRET